MVPKLHPLRAWPRILLGPCLFTDTYVAFLVGCAAQSGMDCLPVRIGRGVGGRALCLPPAANAHRERGHLWRRLWIISHLLDCLLGHHPLPRYRGNGQIRDHQVVDGQPDQRCPSAGAPDRLCLWSICGRRGRLRHPGGGCCGDVGRPRLLSVLCFGALPGGEYCSGRIWFHWHSGGHAGWDYRPAAG